jgi:hypothetical protein
MPVVHENVNLRKALERRFGAGQLAAVGHQGSSQASGLTSRIEEMAVFTLFSERPLMITRAPSPSARSRHERQLVFEAEVHFSTIS